ncbi:MAG: tRNA (adenosine(37)-N6)-dimethylallyltransferase MiaA [Tepidimonas ignava]|uniref:tRNA dimethylallyltransferase n=1 Tax=Tepidimonas ignava TaxID=114249 RepID=A0A4R3LIE5_9BURK|nr:tRNA (adenosine(37)-N6)-dimethylallyltransferase MiaA [Tepidimonas ignava]MCX7814382.1 tRNA (adenosine(37)-N6)-dimethylallyltransferase MiaA [Tepidimonas ignava]TCS99490.1 tRNA dimethylallyltransferase [Tepidimonas ignava]TSE21990.1 tRNA dimethylallyltransferase [Tepidimonas ignava]
MTPTPTSANRVAWLALAGPTASGKTALALALAQDWPLEIISVDSALVYRGMDIGTAKPSATERAQVPHHLIDIRDPSEPYSAAEFVRDATALLHAIRARGRWPLLVGGTMLYFKALLEGLDELPPAQPELRAAIEAEARARGWPALHADLARVDPVTAARLPPHDAQRIGRALEVWRATGQPLSALQRRWRGAPAIPAAPTVDGLSGCLLSLEPSQRDWLRARIDARLRAMWDGGLVDEVRRLRARAELHLGLPALRCVGYRQVWEALDAAGDAALDAAAHALLHERTAAATRQLAKRQLTWLRSMPQRVVLPADAPEAELRRALWRQVSAAWGPPGGAPAA